MDWTQALTIIGINAAFFIYLMSRIEGFSNKIGVLDNRITTLEAEVKHNSQRMTDFQMQVNQRFNTLENYIIPKKIIQDEPKEN